MRGITPGPLATHDAAARVRRRCLGNGGPMRANRPPHSRPGASLMHQSDIAITPLPLLRATSGDPLQVCRLTVADLLHGGEATLHLRRAGADFSFPLTLPAGS